MREKLLHGRFSIIAYFLGVLLYILGLISNNGLLLFIAFILSGYMMIYEGIEDTVKKTIKRKRFTPNIHILMTVGALGAISIKEYGEAALLMIIFTGAHFLEHYAENKSKREITSLLQLNPTQARRILANGDLEIVAVEDLKIGDQIRVLNGDQIATDGLVIEGYSSIDQSAITGESIPVEVVEGSEVFGGTINGDGVFTFEVTKDSSETVIAKIIEVVSQTQTNLSKTATMIKRIEPIYVIIALLFAPVFYLMGLYLFKWGADESFYRTMVYLIGVSPCALAATDIPATLSAISNLARHGVLFKGGSFLSNFSDVKAIAFDKTGTLTEGKPQVVDIVYIDTDEDLNKHYVNLIYSMEHGSNHPLATAIIKHFDGSELIELDAKNILGVGLEANYESKIYKITKPTALEHNDHVKGIKDQLESQGKTVVLFSVYDQVKVLIAIQDQPKASAKAAINYFKQMGIKTVMITGDSKLTGEAIAKELGIDMVMADVLPSDKADIIKDLKAQFGVVSMVGDGVNDAPALVTADIGIAMGSGTDIAIESADAVLMKNDLANIQYTYKVSRQLRKVVIQNIIFAMGVVLFLVISNMITNLPMSGAVLVHEGSTVLVIISGLRLLRNLDRN